MIYIIQNISREEPGLFQQVLEGMGIEHQIVNLEAEEILPPVEHIRALVILGGPDSANDLTLKIRGELQLIQEVLARDIPYLGVCLGMQLLVKAAGGRVIPCQRKEVGFRDLRREIYEISLTGAGRRDPIFSGLPDRFPIFQLHGETVEITSNMELLATGTHCAVQMVRVGHRAYGIQGHLELTADMLDRWLATDPELKPLDAGQIRQDFQYLWPSYHKIGTQLFRNFLMIAGRAETQSPDSS